MDFLNRGNFTENMSVCSAEFLSLMNKMHKFVPNGKKVKKFKEKLIFLNFLKTFQHENGPFQHVLRKMAILGHF